MHHGERQGYGQGLFEWTRVACMGSVLGFVSRSIPTPMIERVGSDAFYEKLSEFLNSEIHLQLTPTHHVRHPSQYEQSSRQAASRPIPHTFSLGKRDLSLPLLLIVARDVQRSITIQAKLGGLIVP
jgi:hypothetical protein